MKEPLKNRFLLTGIVSLFLIAGLVSAYTTLGPTKDVWREHLSAVDQALGRGDQAQLERHLEAAVAAAGRSPGQRLRLAAALEERAADLGQAVGVDAVYRWRSRCGAGTIWIIVLNRGGEVPVGFRYPSDPSHV